MPQQKSCRLLNDFSLADRLLGSESAVLITVSSASLLLGALGINALSGFLPAYLLRLAGLREFFICKQLQQIAVSFRTASASLAIFAAVPFEFVRRQAVRRLVRVYYYYGALGVFLSIAVAVGLWEKFGWVDWEYLCRNEGF